MKNFIKLILDELNIKKVIWKLDKSTDEIKVKLDINLNTQLKEEAQVRELIRKIQNERKILGLNLLHKTKIVNNWIPKDKKMVEKILQKTSSVTIEKGKLFKVIKI